ncbi:MAG: hypothetical protein U1D69_09170 [Polynucleobacter sp.]|nr:hypothetical protein [Hydrogenophaga sp.]MDZ4057121.1 hypothetical protein [Polynucleobacter sp.]
MKTIRVLIPGDTQNEEDILLAIQYADKICELKQGTVQEATLFAPGKESVRYTTISTAIGEKNAKKLHDGGVVLLPTGIPMRLETIRTLRWISKPSILISVYSDQKMLDQVDSLANIVGIVAIPHAPDALQQWESTWSPTVHGQPEQPTSKLIADPILEQALLSLTRSVNLSHGVLHPSDKESSENTLRILRVHGHSDEPQKIRSWAIQNGWQPRAADELGKLANKIFSLKSKPRLKNSEVAQKTYDYWRSKI